MRKEMLNTVWIFCLLLVFW